VKILLTGCNGQVGWELQRTLLPLGSLICADRTQANFTELDTLRYFVRKHEPDVIVNAAAYTAVDKAESEGDLAYRINAEAPAVIAEEAYNLNALLLHYSTDYVFNGLKNSPYDECDAANPLNVYGTSKLAGEQAIQASQADSVILRTSWVYAAQGKNFLKTIIRLACEREELSIVADQHGAPTWARLIAETTTHIIRQSVLEKRQGDFKSGTYNLVPSGKTSWYEFSKKIIEHVKNTSGLTIKSHKIHPITTEEYQLPAKRPANSMLSLERLENHFNLTMPSWETCLKLCLAELFADT